MTPEIFELLSQLQEYGHPPETLMKEIHEKFGTANMDAVGGGGNLPNMEDMLKDLNMPSGMNDMMMNLMKDLGGP